MTKYSCPGCGEEIDINLDMCDECMEREINEAKILLQEFNEFERKFEELVGDGRDIADRLGNNFGYKTTAERFRLYLLNRMENFFRGGEMFQTQEIRDALVEFIGEED